MITLEKKERSLELNGLDRILIDFKSLVDEGNFIIYKSNGLVHYIFDLNGFFKITKTSGHLKLEDFLDEDEFVKIVYSEVKGISSLKKSQVMDIFYDSDVFTFETCVDDVTSQYVIKKHKDIDNIMKRILEQTSDNKLDTVFTEASYDISNQTLISKVDGSIYPYKITFSDDINFKLKIDEPGSVYYIRLLNGGTFIQVVTVTEYKEIYKAQAMLFIFNYLNNREV